MTEVLTCLKYEVDGEIKSFPLDRLAVCRIGRGSENSIVVDDGLSSREHAMIRRDASGHCILTDLGSRNGTRVNNRPISTPTKLVDGDSLLVGRLVLTFVQPEAQIELSAKAVEAATQFMLSESLITVLVADIRGFTMLSQILGEKRISELMAEVFRSAGQVLDSKRAWSQKFIGDALMGVWAHPSDTLSAAELLNIFDVIGELQEIFRPLQRQFDLLRPLQFGCGINTGFAAVGNIGSASAQDFTAMGDAVNKTFRLETATKEMGCDILIGASTIELLRPQLQPDQLPEQKELELKGYDAKEVAFGLNFADLSGFSSRVAKNIS
jgi:adenylate cyclase